MPTSFRGEQKMRTKKEIIESTIDKHNGYFQTSEGQQAILEVLLDIRDLLHKKVNNKP
jgi:hypothetical protein